MFDVFLPVFQNHLQFIAISNLEAATFQVSYQMKILTTAAFSVLLLRKKLSSTQWLALLLLAIGVGIVQMQSIISSPTKTHDNVLNLHTMNYMRGLLAVVAACFTSGLAGVYFEMVLKNSQCDIWIRNVQLSLFSLLPALLPIIFTYLESRSGAQPMRNFGSLFNNFGPWAWATVAIQVIGGLLTALVVKYSDNILKGFATSLSIVISFLASIALFNFKITFSFLLGSLLVVIATCLYNQRQNRCPVSWGTTKDEASTAYELCRCCQEDNTSDHSELSRSLLTSSQSSSSLSNISDSEHALEKDRMFHSHHIHSGAQ